MTPRHPWRRRVSDDLVAVLWLLAIAVLIGSALGKCIAHAEPFTPGQAYADQHAADICLTLDARPTVTGVWALLADLTTTGLSGVESGVAVKESVVYVCPHHLPLLHRFVTYYQHRQSGVTA